MGYARKTTNREKITWLETYTPNPLQRPPSKPNVELVELKDDKEVSRKAFTISSFIGKTVEGNEHDQLPSLCSVSAVPGAPPPMQFEAVTTVFFKPPALSLKQPIQFNFFEYTGYDKTLAQARAPEVVDFSTKEKYEIGLQAFDINTGKVNLLKRAVKDKPRGVDKPAPLEYRQYVLMGPVASTLPGEVWTGGDFYFTDPDKVKIRAELPLGFKFPGAPVDPEVAWTAEMVAGGDMVEVFLDDLAPGGKTTGPAALVTNRCKSGMVMLRLKAKQELTVKSKPFKIRISAKLLVDQPAGKLETALGSFEMPLLYNKK